MSRARAATIRAASPTPPVKRPGLTLLLWLAPLILLGLAYRTVGGFEFVGDARFLILENNFIHELSMLGENLRHNYFWSSSGNIIPYWRPATKGSWVLEYQLFESWAGGYAWVQLAWHALGTIGIQLLARRLGVRPVLSTVAATVYALHPVAIAPTCMIMARSDVVCTAACVWGLLTWREWRASGRKHLWGALHVVAVVVALGSKETAVILPAVLALWSVLEGDLARERRSKLLQLAPAVILSAVYLVTRRVTLTADAEGLAETSLAFDPLRIFASLTVYLRNLLPFLVQSGVRDISPAEAGSPAFVATGLFSLLVVAAVFLIALRRGDRVSLALLAWGALALAPVILGGAIHVPTAGSKFVAADRWLVHALPAVVLLWARLVENFNSQRLVATVPVAAVVWVGFILVGARAARAEFGSEMGMLDNEDRLFLATPERFRSEEDHCRFLDRKAVRATVRSDFEEVLRVSEQSLERCGDPDGLRRFRCLCALTKTGRYEEARPLVEELLASPPPPRVHASFAYEAGLVLFRTGETGRAEVLFNRALELGYRDCRTWIWFAETARARNDLPRAAQRLEAAFQCGGGGDASLLIMAATWWIESGEKEQGARLVKLARENFQLTPDQADQVSRLEKAL